jgi:FkbM family methyltransferase
LKRLVESILGTRKYLVLSSLYLHIVKATGYLLAGMLRVIPSRFRVALKENLNITRALDYPSGNIRLRVESLTEYITRLNSCRKEPETVAWIERFIKPGDVAFDIGANVGAYSFVMDRSTKGQATIYAFEPSFANYAQLVRNTGLNNCSDRIYCMPVAFSDRTTISRFHYSSISPGAALHALDNPVDNKGKAFVPVQHQHIVTYRMDDFLRHFDVPKPNHIKLDVDGNEWKILCGAEETLSCPDVRTILVELEPSLETSRKITEYLLSKKFRLDSSQSHGTDPDLDTNNAIFLRD